MLISHQERTTFTHVLKKLQCELAEPLAKVSKTASLSACVLEDSGSCLCNSQVQEAQQNESWEVHAVESNLIHRKGEQFRKNKKAKNRT